MGDYSGWITGKSGISEWAGYGEQKMWRGGATATAVRTSRRKGGAKAKDEANKAAALAIQHEASNCLNGVFYGPGERRALRNCRRVEELV